MPAAVAQAAKKIHVSLAFPETSQKTPVRAKTATSKLTKTAVAFKARKSEIVRMAEPQILSTLRRKCDDIEAAIATYEAKIEEARRDLAAVAATIRLFELNGEARQFPAYADVSRPWKRGEMVTVCREALAKEGPLDTRELAVRVLRAKGMDEGDKVLRHAVRFRIVQALGAGGEAWDGRERRKADGGSSTSSATAISRAAIYAARARHSAKATERRCL